MLAPFAPNGLVVRTLFFALAVLGSVYFLLRTFDVGPFGRDATLFLTPTTRRPATRIMKVTERLEPVNELYQASLQSHEEHDRLHGYTIKVFRERMVEAYNSIPTYLLSIIVSELQKPARVRTNWLVWFSGDVVLLNPQIPLEIFLPPVGFEHVNVLATHDDEGFNAGVFFIRVDAWSVKMLTDVVECRENRTEIKEARFKHQKALELTLRGPDFREKVLYQPRQWYNAYARDSQPRGYLLTHFNSHGGDKWAQMDETLRQLSTNPAAFSIPVGATEYLSEIEGYWSRLRRAYELLPKAGSKVEEERVQAATRRLQYAITYETDKEMLMQHALVKMKVALGMMNDGDIL